MGGSAGKSESDSNTGFQSEVWGPQGDALKGLYGQLGNLFTQSNQGMQNQIPGAVNGMKGVTDAATPHWQKQMEGGAYSGMDLQGNYQNALQGGGNEQFMNEQIMGGAGNDYVDAMKDQMQQDSDDILGRSLAMTDARAAGNQLGGSSRHGLVQADQIQNSNRNLMDAQTRLGYDTFDKDMDRKMDIARNADRFDMARLDSTGQMLGDQNQAMQGGLKGSQGMQNLNMGQFAPYMAPWQAAGQYSQGIGAPTVLGSGSGDSNSKGVGFGGGRKG